MTTPSVMQPPPPRITNHESLITILESPITNHYSLFTIHGARLTRRVMYHATLSNALAREPYRPDERWYRARDNGDVESPGCRCSTGGELDPACLESTEVQRVGRRHRRTATQRRGRNHTVDERASMASRVIEKPRSNRSVFLAERDALGDDLRRELHLMLIDGTTEKFRPGNSAHAQWLPAGDPLAESAVMRRSRNQGADEEARVQVDHGLSVPAPPRGRLPLGSDLLLPAPGGILGQRQRTLQSIERLERAALVRRRPIRRRPDGAAQRFGFRHLPPSRHRFELPNRIHVQRIGRFDCRYGHTRNVWPYRRQVKASDAGQRPVSAEDRLRPLLAGSDYLVRAQGRSYKSRSKRHSDLE